MREGFDEGWRMDEVSGNVPVPFPSTIELGNIGSLYRPAAIGTLPDDALLEIFGFYVENASEAYGFERMKGWYTPTHVCKRWRNIAFASPAFAAVASICYLSAQAQDL